MPVHPFDLQARAELALNALTSLVDQERLAVVLELGDDAQILQRDKAQHHRQHGFDQLLPFLDR